MKSRLRIGDLAGQFQVSVETVRYFEKQGLLPQPERSEGNFRLYSDAHRERLAFILNCRALDMTHVEIRELLRVRDQPELGCNSVNNLIDEHVLHVRSRIELLQTLESELVALRRKCNATTAAKDCAILDQLGKRSEKKKARILSSLGVHSAVRSSE
jgi:Cd(II)/Pb(II)-responsive transcriptional regulator